MKRLSRKKRLLIMIIGLGLGSIFTFSSGLAFWYVRTTDAEPPLFAFASDRAGAGDIFVLDQHGQLHNLTDHPSTDWDPDWSFDGKRLAFTSHRAGNSDIWLIEGWLTDPPLEPINLTNHPAWDYSPSWSPSGRSVAFVSERDGDPEIFIQNLEGETALQLTFNEEMDRLPAWSPDSKYIAFAAVRQGVEEIHLVRPDGTDEQLVTPQPLQGTSPAWSPDSQKLAFIGWNDERQAGIYTVGPDLEHIDLLYQSESWIGSLGWSADGEWLTFTAWNGGNHELYALPANGLARPTRLTINDAWDDTLALNPVRPFTISAANEGIAQAAAAHRLPASADFAAGVNMADLGLAYLINDLGLTWGKSYVNWGTVETAPGQYNWQDPDNIIEAFGDQEVNILMRVHGTPDWARPAESHYSHPPHDVEDFANFMTALASRYRGQVAAYEIWNEPNLNYEWGYQQPDPAAYTELLKAAYTAVKAVDPDALIISGGLSTTGDGSATAYGDLAFLQGMYDAGAEGYFDAFGSHAYAYGHAPDEIHPNGLSLARVVEQHEVMVANGDGDTPIWITETGWILDSHWDLGEHAPFAVTQQQQAAYLARAYEKAQAEWPFVQGFFLFNLDFSTVSWYPSGELMRWYAILNPDRSPRPAYTELRGTVREE